MDNKKLEEILEAMQGITYSEWCKLSRMVEMTFKVRVSNQVNNMKIANPEEILSAEKLL